jgi:hypothetical protein
LTADYEKAAADRFSSALTEIGVLAVVVVMLLMGMGSK